MWKVLQTWVYNKELHSMALKLSDLVVSRDKDCKILGVLKVGNFGINRNIWELIGINWKCSKLQVSLHLAA